VERDPTLTISGHIVAEFDDAAGPVGAREFWMDMIRHYTEPGPGGRLRVRGADDPNRGRVVVEHNQAVRGAAPLVATRHGSELDVSGERCLALIRWEGPLTPDGGAGEGITESITPIPWTDILNVRFEIFRPVASPPSP
jgi:hypothetical protein